MRPCPTSCWAVVRSACCPTGCSTASSSTRPRRPAGCLHQRHTQQHNGLAIKASSQQMPLRLWSLKCSSRHLLVSMIIHWDDTVLAALIIPTSSGLQQQTRCCIKPLRNHAAPAALQAHTVWVDDLLCHVACRAQPATTLRRDRAIGRCGASSATSSCGRAALLPAIWQPTTRG